MENRSLAHSSESLEGRTLGKYRIEQRVGGGGQAVVYKALHLEFQTPVAIKVLTDRVSQSATLRERFKREARLQFKLQHPHIVRAFEIIEEDSLLAIVMDWVEGVDLERYLATHPQLPSHAEIERLFVPVLWAVDEAHKQHIIHRDLKPSNILLSGPVGREIPKVMDFGIAKSLEDDSQHTQTNALLGTPHYIAPEHAASSKYVDHRVDIYALGVTLYQMLCGSLPFAGKDLVQLITAHLTQDPPPMRSWGAEVSPLLEQVARKALEKRPEARFQSCHDFAEALIAALHDDEATALRHLRGTQSISSPQVSAQDVLPTGEMDAYAHSPNSLVSLATTTPAKEPLPSKHPDTSRYASSSKQPDISGHASSSKQSDTSGHASLTQADTSRRAPSRFVAAGVLVLLSVAAVIGAVAMRAVLNSHHPSRTDRSQPSALTQRTNESLSPLPLKTPIASTKKQPAETPIASTKKPPAETPTASASTPALERPNVPPTSKATSNSVIPAVASAKSAPPLVTPPVIARRPSVRKPPYKPNPYLLLPPVGEKHFSSCPDCLHAFWLARRSFRKDACKERPLKVAAKRCVRVCKQDMDFCSSYAMILPYLYPSALRRGGSEVMEDHIDRCSHNLRHNFDKILLQSGYRSGVSWPNLRCASSFQRAIKLRLASRGRKSRFAWSPFDHYPYLP